MKLNKLTFRIIWNFWDMATTAGMRGVFVLIGGFLVHLSLGSFFTFGMNYSFHVNYINARKTFFFNNEHI